MDRGDPGRERHEALRRPSPRSTTSAWRSRGRVLLAARARRAAEDDHAADARRLRGPDRRSDHARGPAGRERPALRARREHGLPELRAVRSPRRRRQRRLRTASARRSPRPRSAAGSARRSSWSASRSAPTRARRAVRRPAAAGGAGAGAGQPPEVLLLDEPLGALDLKLRRQMQVELKQIQREVGITFVYVTHDQEEALSMSDRIAVMNHGSVAQCGLPRRSTSSRPRSSSPASSASRTCSRAPSRTRHGRSATGCAPGTAARRRAGEATVGLSVRPEKIAVDEARAGDGGAGGTVDSRVYLGVKTQITVGLGNGARLVALEQATYRASADDRWEPGTKIKLGWHPENCLVLR